jgi:hypothetical protein
MNIRIFLEFFFVGIIANSQQNVSLIFLDFFYFMTLMTYTGGPFKILPLSLVIKLFL